MQKYQDKKSQRYIYEKQHKIYQKYRQALWSLVNALFAETAPFSLVFQGELSTFSNWVSRCLQSYLQANLLNMILPGKYLLQFTRLVQDRTFLSLLPARFDRPQNIACSRCIGLCVCGVMLPRCFLPPFVWVLWRVVLLWQLHWPFLLVSVFFFVLKKLNTCFPFKLLSRCVYTRV